MRLDHIAYRVKDRYKTVKFLEETLGYSIGHEFKITFEDGSITDCVALLPPEKRSTNIEEWNININTGLISFPPKPGFNLHAPPEIFVSDGEEGSIVGEWVKERGGVGGIHHLAYEVEDVEKTMREWENKGYVEFLSDKPLKCEEPNLTQVFSKPSELTGVIYELIKREDSKGFCEKNVEQLMESTR
jgi:catechol 2,3-dioxygenase-like lactoylglutathione lyase family enzyme